MKSIYKTMIVLQWIRLLLIMIQVSVAFHTPVMPLKSNIHTSKTCFHFEKKGEIQRNRSRKMSLRKNAVMDFVPEKGNDDDDDLENGYIFDDSIESFNMDLLSLTMDNVDSAQNNLQLAEDMLEILNSKISNEDSITPNIASYTICISGWAYYARNRQQKIIAGSKAQRLLDYVSSNSDKIGEPNVLTYTATVSAWAVQAKTMALSRISKHRGHEAVLNAEKVLYQMLDLNMPWDVKTCTEVLAAWSLQRIETAADSARQLLKKMEELYQTGLHPDVRPNLISFTAVINAYAQSSNLGAAEKADELLKIMQSKHDIRPDVIAYSACINAWAKSGSPEKAESLLYELEAKYENTRDESLQPNVVTYTTVISAYANSPDKGAPLMAEAILEHMQVLYRSGSAVGAKPRTASYNAVIDAWARVSGKIPEAAKRAEKILDNMERCFEAGDDDVKPNTRSYSEVIFAYCKKGDARKCMKLLQRMEELHFSGSSVRPNVYSYTLVISALASAGEPQKAEEILQRMINISSRANSTCNRDAIPNEKTFFIVISAWAKSGKPEKAQRILDLMEEMFLSDDSNPRPNVVCYNAVLNAWAGNGQATQALKIISRMEHLSKDGYIDAWPDTISFNTCINAFSRSDDDDAIDQAENIVKHMVEITSSGNVYAKPDSITYNTLLMAYGQRSKTLSRLERVNEILRLMENEYISGNRDMKPSEITYNNAINAWAKSDISNKAVRAREILESMKTSQCLEAGPNLYAYTSVMNAAAYTRGDFNEQTEALKILWSTFNDITTAGLHPNHITYVTFIHGIKNLMRFNEERSSILKSIIRKCIHDGQVSRKVFFAYKGAASMKDLEELGVKEISQIPPEWSKNC